MSEPSGSRDDGGSSKPWSPHSPSCECCCMYSDYKPPPTKCYVLYDECLSEQEDDYDLSDEYPESDQSSLKNQDPIRENSDSRFDNNNRRQSLLPCDRSFFQHDVRVAEKEVEVIIISGNVGTADTPDWSHDLFVEEEQGPKSLEEIIDTYGYDIRNNPNPYRKNLDGSKKTFSKNKNFEGRKCAIVKPMNFSTSSREDSGLNGRSSQFRNKKVSEPQRPFYVSETRRDSVEGSVDDQPSTSTMGTSRHNEGPRAIGSCRQPVVNGSNAVWASARSVSNLLESDDDDDDSDECCESHNTATDSNSEWEAPSARTYRAVARPLTMVTMNETTVSHNGVVQTPAQPQLFQAVAYARGLPHYYNPTFTVRLEEGDYEAGGDIVLIDQVWSGGTVSWPSGPIPVYPQQSSVQGKIPEDVMINWVLYRQPESDQPIYIPCWVEVDANNESDQPRGNDVHQAQGRKPSPK